MPDVSVIVILILLGLFFPKRRNGKRLEKHDQSTSVSNAIGANSNATATEVVIDMSLHLTSAKTALCGIEL